MNFDLHTHVSLKTMLGGTTNKKRESCWKEVKTKVLDAVSGGAISSQSSLKQVKQGDVKLAVAALYSLEQAFAKNWLLSKFVPNITSKLSKDYINSIKNNSLSPFYNLQQELKHIEDAVDKDLKIISKVSEIDNNKINLALATEGMHNFQDMYEGKTSEILQSIRVNFNSFKLKNRILYTGLTHLTQHPVCTHAYAMKLIEDDEFKPSGTGLSDFGKQIVDDAYSQTGFNNKRTLIDIKHMSLNARMQFYSYRDLKGYQNIPIICSHSAVTGKSYNNIYIKSSVFDAAAKRHKVTHQKTFSDVAYKNDIADGFGSYVSFNPWTLNLFDEEIIKIIDSKGIIGMIMDERVLGAKGVDTSSNDNEGLEFFSNECYADFIDHNNFNFTTNDTEPKTEPDIHKIVGRKGTRHLYANIIHIVKTYHKKYNNLNAWDHICIGSDSDGLIKTISDYGDSSGMNDIKDALADVFDAERKGPHAVYFGMWPTDTLIQKIFFNNGYNFISTNL